MVVRAAGGLVASGLVVLASLGGIAHAVPASGCRGPGWVAAWAGVPSDASVEYPSESRQSEVEDAFAPGGDESPGTAKMPVDNATIRAVLTPSIAGATVRVHLSNRFGSVPVTFAHATIGKQASGGTLTGAPAELAFAGKASITVPPGKDVVSDAAAFSFNAYDNLVVSVYVPGDAGKPTEHYTARQFSYYTPNGLGDHSADVDGSAFTFHFTARPFVTGLDIQTNRPAAAVVAFGDSITDGFQGQPPAGIPETREGIDANGRWPDVLGRRIRAVGLPLAVANAGISGNRVLRDGIDGGGPDEFGVAALKRLDADVLQQAGAGTVIWLEGINDLGQAPVATAQEIIDGYKRGIVRMHAAGLRVLMGTLTPAGGDSSGNYGTPGGEATRQAVNRWIRTQKVADGFVDFDAAVRDPADPQRIRPDYDGGDHLHFNLAGYKAMGDAVDLAALGRPSCGGALAAKTRSLRVHVLPRTLVAGRRTTLRVSVRLGGRPVRGATIRFGRYGGRTDARGVARIRVRARRAARRRVIVRAAHRKRSIRIRVVRY